MTQVTGLDTTGFAPESGAMVWDHLPALVHRLEPMFGDQGARGIENLDPPVEGDVHDNRFTAQRGGQTVAITLRIDEGVQSDQARFTVSGLEGVPVGTVADGVLVAQSARRRLP